MVCICWEGVDAAVAVLKRRMKGALRAVVALAVLMAMLPAAAVEARDAGPVSPRVDAPALLLLLQNGNPEALDPLPQGARPVQKIIPRRCAAVRQNHQITIPVVVAPASLLSLTDLVVTWDGSRLTFVRSKLAPGRNRMTLYLTFLAVGKPTKTTRVYYQSTGRAASKSRTYVTIVPQKVTGVRLDPAGAALYVGQTLPLTATVLPSTASNKSVRWTSSNRKVATVSSSGVVTAKRPGKATIYVVTRSGGKRARCRIAVTQPAVS